MTTPNDNLLDQHRVNALASMVIVQLPFPPMPMCAIKGEDRDDVFCSSHDLLARAIAVQYTNNVRQTGSGMPSEALTLQKTEILTNLLNDLIKMSITDVDIIDNSEAIYNVFQNHFRSYMSLYPSTSKDIRFAPIEAVDASSLIMSQAVAHLNALNLQDSDCTHKEAKIQPKTYREALQCYFTELVCGVNEMKQ